MARRKEGYTIVGKVEISNEIAIWLTFKKMNDQTTKTALINEYVEIALSFLNSNLQLEKINKELSIILEIEKQSFANSFFIENYDPAQSKVLKEILLRNRKWYRKFDD